MAIKPIDTDEEGYAKEPMKPIEPIKEEEYDMMTKSEEKVYGDPRSWKEKIKDAAYEAARRTKEGAKEQALKLKEEWKESRKQKAEEDRLYREARRDAYKQAKVTAIRARARLDAERSVMGSRSGGVNQGMWTSPKAFLQTDLGGGDVLYGKSRVRSEVRDPIGGISMGGGSLLGGAPIGSGFQRAGKVKAPKMKGHKGHTPGLTLHISGSTLAGLGKKHKHKRRR